MDIEGVSAQADFEVIKIIDDRNPYPLLLGIDWAIDVNGVINLKKQTIPFKRKSLYILVPLYPAKGPCYIDPVHDHEDCYDDLDQIYKITIRDQHWINLIANGLISRDHEISYTSDLEEELEHW